MATYLITLTETTEYSVTVNDEQMARILAQAGVSHTPGAEVSGLDVEEALHFYSEEDEFTREWPIGEGEEHTSYEYSVETLPGL